MRVLIALCAGLLGTTGLIGLADAAPIGKIEGRVIDGVTGRPVAGVRLTLTTGTANGGGEVVARLRSDAEGRYSFGGLETGDDRYYALDARFEGGLFAGRPVTLPSDTERKPVVQSTLRVWPTTTEPDAIVVKRDDQFVISNESGLSVIESVTIMNRSTDAYIGRGLELAGAGASGASVAFALPAGAEGVRILDSELDIPQLVPADAGFAATVAFPPGETTTTFSYMLPGEAETFDLSKPALYPVEEMSIFAAEPLEIRSNRLEPDGEKTLEGRTFMKWTSTTGLDAGDPLQALAVAQSGASTVPLVAALLGGGLLMAGAMVVVGKRMRAGDGRGDGPPQRAQKSYGGRTPLRAQKSEREGLIERVARVDLEHEAGDIAEAEWRQERAALLERLRSLDPGDP